jgi:subtilisin-like proprotein convertase family protein
LALESNFELGWREVQLLIAKSGVSVDLEGGEWSVGNGRGFRHSQKYGFGLLDAKAMVEMAKKQKKLPDQKGFSSGLIQVYLSIPADGTPTCVSHKFTRSGINYVEHVLLRIGLRHPRRGQIKVTLKSPENIISTLADQHPDPQANYPQNGWLFTSVRHFGEQSADGDWQICVSDTVYDYYSNGVFDFFELAVFGHYEQ